MTHTATDIGTVEPLSRTQALELGHTAYVRMIDALRPLSDDEWGRQTPCTQWNVRDLAGHVAGMMASMSTIRGAAAEQRAAAKRGKQRNIDPVDAMTSIQVEAMASLSTAQLIDRMESLVGPAIAGRGRLPEVIARRAKFPQVVNGETEKWTLSYLLGIIVTRDTWLHRVADVAIAVDQTPVLDQAHDGRIVSDVVAEWVRRHRKPVDLVLTGPAGGEYRHSSGGPRIEVDAIDFCRILSGRAEPTHELLTTQVPF